LDQIEGFKVPVRRALTEVVFWGGVPREALVFNVLFTVLVVAIFHFWYVIPLSIAAHFLFIFLGKNDPMFFHVFMRYQRTREYYWS